MQRIEDHPEFEDLPSADKIWEIELDEAITCCTLSADGTILGAGTVENEITIIDTDNGKEINRLKGHHGGVNCIQFCGDVVLSCGDDGTLKIWTVSEPTALHTVPIEGEDVDRTGAGHSVNHLAISPTGLYFAAAAGKTVHLFELKEKPSPPELVSKAHMPAVVESITFNREGSMVGFSYYGGVSVVNLTGLPDHSQTLPLTYPSGCLCLAISSNGEWVAAGCHDASVHIFHIVESEEGADVQGLACDGYETKVTSLIFDPSQTYLATAGGERGLVWEFKPSPYNSVPIMTVGHRGLITCLAWQPDGPFLATGGKDGRVFIYALEYAEPGRPKIALPGAYADCLGDEITTLNWGDDGVLYTGHISGYVRKSQLTEEEE